jgi:predicted amidohydrolase
MKLVLVQPCLRLASDADNLGIIRAQLDAADLDLDADDIVLLPESFERSGARLRYRRRLRALACALGCHVVGGSHPERVDGGAVNAGLAFSPSGEVIGRYEKLHPYASERLFVRPGAQLGEFAIAGRNVLVLVCADFFFADLVQRATRVPDLILVPACSVTRKDTPEYSRTLWRCLAVARAYEFGAVVGISDWAYASELPASGVGGCADPTTTAPDRLFVSIGDAGVAVFPLDFAALEDFRTDRRARGFLWKKSSESTHRMPPTDFPIHD